MSDVQVALFVVNTNNAYGNDACDGDAGFYGPGPMVVPMAPRRGGIPQFGIPGSGRPYGTPGRGAMPFIPPALARSLVMNPNFFSGNNPNFGLNAANFQNQLLMQLLQQQLASNNNINIGNGNSFGLNQDALSAAYLLGRQDEAAVSRVRTPRRPAVTTPAPTTPPTTPGRLSDAEISTRATAIRAQIGTMSARATNPEQVRTLLEQIPNADDRIKVMKQVLSGIPGLDVSSLGDDKNKIVEAFGKQLVRNQGAGDQTTAAGTQFLSILEGLKQPNGVGLSAGDVAKQAAKMKTDPAWAGFNGVPANSNLINAVIARSVDAETAARPAGTLTPRQIDEKVAEIKDGFKLKPNGRFENPTALINKLNSLQGLSEADKDAVLRKLMTLPAAEGGFGFPADQVDTPYKLHTQLLSTLINRTTSWDDFEAGLNAYGNLYKNSSPALFQSSTDWLRNFPGGALLDLPGRNVPNPADKETMAADWRTNSIIPRLNRMFP